MATKKLDDLIRRAADDKRSTILLSRGRVLGSDPAEVAYEVLRDPELAASLALIRDDPFDMKGMIRSHIKGRVGQYMRTAKYTYSDGETVRQWEVVRIAGRKQGRWLPTRGMMVWQWRTSGEAKVRQGADTLHEGRVLLAMADAANRRGYKDNEVVKSGEFDSIVREAKLALG